MIDETLLDYWTRSQKLRSLSSTQAQQTYIDCSIRPAFERETDPKKKALLERLVA